MVYSLPTLYSGHNGVKSAINSLRSDVSNLVSKLLLENHKQILKFSYTFLKIMFI